MVLFIGSKWFSLQDEFFSVLTIIISPAVHFRNFARPVAVSRTNRCRPLNGIGSPWIFGGYFPSFEYVIEEVKNKHQLHGEYHHSDGGYKSVQVCELVER